MRVVSFDIDGTLTSGNPPGVITRDMVLAVKLSGSLVGSASDLPVNSQWELWRAWGINPDFVVLKHQLESLLERFVVEEYWHIGDSEVDRYFAERAGFRFFWADSYPEQGHREYI